MTKPLPRGLVPSLVLACHPLPTAAMTIALTVAAALTGRPAEQCALVAGTVLTGQLSVGWLNDVLDRDRDAEVGRRDKPVAMGWIDPGTVVFAIAVAVLLVIPLSIANGTEAGLAHLGAVASAWLYNLVFKRTVLSWLPYAVSFGLLPAFHGRGLGGALLEFALRRGFALGSRVWLHTTTTDGPAALPNYRARGLVPYKEEPR